MHGCEGLKRWSNVMLGFEALSIQALKAEGWGIEALQKH